MNCSADCASAVIDTHTDLWLGNSSPGLTFAERQFCSSQRSDFARCAGWVFHRGLGCSGSHIGAGRACLRGTGLWRKWRLCPGLGEPPGDTDWFRLSSGQAEPITRRGCTYLAVTSKSHLWNAFFPLSFVWNAWGQRNCFRSSPTQSGCDLSRSAAISGQRDVSVLQSLVEMCLLLLLLCCCWVPQGLLQVAGLSAAIARWNLICWTYAEISEEVSLWCVLLRCDT